MNSSNPFRSLPEDGLYTPVVGSWAEEKYRLLFHYASMFSTSMKHKWQRVYIDLFSAAGKSRIRGTDRHVLASPLLALEVPDQFDRYIFCEQKRKPIEALKERVSEVYPEVDARFIKGDVNELVDDVLREYLSYYNSERVLGFCFADPYGMSNLKFDTIKRLSAQRMDFLVLIPTDMDAIRNIARYTSRSNPIVDQFMGTDEWRLEWAKARSSNLGFDIFIGRYYSDQLKKLGYKYGGLNESVLIRSTERRHRLYRLGFYSRHQLGGKFWDETKKYSTDQRSLFD